MSLFGGDSTSPMEPRITLATHHLSDVINVFLKPLWPIMKPMGRRRVRKESIIAKTLALLNLAKIRFIETLLQGLTPGPTSHR